MKISYSCFRQFVNFCWLPVYILVFTSGCQKHNLENAMDSPVPAKEALSTFELEPGFKIELIASEPLIADPVAMEIDENGNLYVVENHGYPLDKSKTSKVKLLKDTNGDGQMDTSTIFADSLMMPTGVMRWKKGILVTDAPNLLYLEDSDGDGKADITEIVLTGFALSNPQHNVNNPILGLDNWIYLAHERAIESSVYKEAFGDRGGDIYYPAMPDGKRLPDNASGRSIRFNPGKYDLEEVASSSQYGHSFDVWGNYLLVSNANHIIHSVIPAEYFNRNPKMLVSGSTRSISDHGSAAEVFPITRNRDRQLLTDVGVMTSACAITAYSGGAFPDEFNTNTTFVAEPVSSIVHADRLKPAGSSFIASRVRSEKEFLASTDMWFRPVNMYIGPDGALYIVDYYREIIEHPEWLADEVINSGKLYNGNDMGRIYRISATDAKSHSWTTDLALGKATDEALVEKLADPNIWWRRNAQRMLVDRNKAQIIPALVAMVGNERSATGRLHALWTLSGMNQLRPEQIADALRDPEPGVRVNAIKLAELQLNSEPMLEKSLISLQDDADPKVRFQLLCTLGFINSPEAAQVRNKLLFKDIEDEFVQVAALSAPASQTEDLLESVIARYQPDISAYGSLLQSLSAMAVAGEKDQFSLQLLQKATQTISEEKVTWQVPVLKGMARGFNNKNSFFLPLEQDLLLKTFFLHPSFSVRQGSLQVLQAKKIMNESQTKSAMEKARRVAGDPKVGEEERVLMINFLALKNPVSDAPFLKTLILSEKSLAIQLAALKTLNAIPDETVAHFALDQWSALPPAIQDAALNTFMQKEERLKMLVVAVESGKIQQSSIGWQRGIRLMTQRDITFRNRARALLAKDGQRQKIIGQYQPALKMKGDPAKGKIVHQNKCAICHQVKGEAGISFGPDLGTIQRWPPSGIMDNILDPNQSISHGFDLWNVALKNGASMQGIITEETPSAITLRNANGQVNTVAREEMISQKALHMSAMPMGLEKDISLQDMADLLAFLKKGE